MALAQIERTLATALRFIGFAMIFVLLLAAVSSFLTPVPPVAAQNGETILVTPSGTGDGSSWANAASLQDALTTGGNIDAVSGDEIWVASGIYTPGTQRSDTFQLVDGVKIYGGFTVGDAQRSDRDSNPNTNGTVLSGDIEGNDTTTASGVVIDTANINGANSYHVVTGSGVTTSAVLDGFTITAGNADGANDNNLGGGMFNDSGSPTLTNITISGNQAEFGGGMDNLDNSSPTLTNVTIAGNSANVNGGGLRNIGSSNATLTNVIIFGNSAHGDGGGIFNRASNPTLTNVTIAGNRAGVDGGGLGIEDSNATIQNSIIWGNGFDQVGNENSTVTYSYSLVQDRDLSGSNNNLDGTSATPDFVNPINADSAPTTSGDYRLQAGSDAIDRGDGAANSTTSDLAGNPRTFDDWNTSNYKGNIIDLGAYEFGSTAALRCLEIMDKLSPTPDDLDGDGLVDDFESTIGTDPADPDTDGDCLLDGWEVFGFDLDGDGEVDVSSGEVFETYEGFVRQPDPLHKDIYLEVDFQDCFEDSCVMLSSRSLADGIEAICNAGDILADEIDISCERLAEEIDTQVDPMHHMPDLPITMEPRNLPEPLSSGVSLQDMKGTEAIIMAFGNAPVTNPDGEDGINLHVLIDENIIHAPNCDQDTSAVREDYFGTRQQRNDNDDTNPVLDAKALAFRYVWSGHSTLYDHDPNDPDRCPNPGYLELLVQGSGFEPLKEYDTTPFGDVNIGGRDILISLSPGWYCPRKQGPIINGYELEALNLCYQAKLPVGPSIPGVENSLITPGIFPAELKAVDGSGTMTHKWPINRLLGLEDPEAFSQLWARTFMQLLGNSLGLESAADVGNDPVVTGTHPPDSYANWDNLQYDPTRIGVPLPEKKTLVSAAYDTLIQADPDGDGVSSENDNCPAVHNPPSDIPLLGQEDSDGDGIGDACDSDRDGDLLPNPLPNSLGVRVSQQTSMDPHPDDTDNDGVSNSEDQDDDGDGVNDDTDNCVLVPNEDQADTDGDGTGDACEADADDDGQPTVVELVVGSDYQDAESRPEFIGADNTCNDGLDNDGDGQIDGEDDGCIDTDGDSAPDILDNCPTMVNYGWNDTDGDGRGDICDREVFLPLILRQ